MSSSKKKLKVRVKRSRLESVGLAMLLPLLILITWYVGTGLRFNGSTFLDPYFCPPFERIVSAGVNLVKGNHLQMGILYSLMRIMVSSLISSAISIPLGIVMASNERCRSLFDFLVKLRYLPAFALLPLIILVAGIEEADKISFLVVSITLYLLPSAILALDGVPDQLIDTARTLGASEFQVVRRVLIPAALPDIFQSFVVINGIGWNALMVAEIINARHGLGHILNMSRYRGQMDAVIFALIVIYIIAVIMDSGIKYSIRKLFRWKYK
jgi:ABC-type nitrate/sulfonate/bicarbonate transport system permease component